MPFDKKGKHHLNTQKAMASDKASSAPAAEPASDMSAPAADPLADDQQQIVTCPQCGAQFVNDPAEQAQLQGGGEGAAQPMPEHGQHAPMMSGM